MAFPSSQHRPQQALGSGLNGSDSAHGSGGFPARPNPELALQGAETLPNGGLPLPNGGEHTLEKLEFALAVALTRGDVDRSQSLREQIAALGGNQEEPGT